MKIEKFDSKQYFRKFESTKRSSTWNGASDIWEIEFLRDGGAIELIASYYKAKYEASIITINMDDNANKIGDLRGQIHCARALAENETEYRSVLLVKYLGRRSYDNGHVIPIIYVKANGREALFLANSLGSRWNDHQWLFKEHNLPVYVIEGWRQHENTGCIIDAFAIIKEAVGKSNGIYKIPDLLTWLKNNCKDGSLSGCSGYEYVSVYKYKGLTKLHPRLLKTAQKTDFTPAYLAQSDIDIIVNKKGETIGQHFKRYTKLAANSESLPSYIAQKSMKYRGIVEIEFYLQQLKSKDWFTAEQRAKFIEGAWSHLKPGAAPSAESVSLLYDYALQCTESKDCKVDPLPKQEELTKPQEPKRSEPSLFYTVASCSIGLMAVGAVLAFPFKMSPNIPALRMLASYFHLSENTSAVITNAAIGALMGQFVGLAVHSVRSI